MSNFLTRGITGFVFVVVVIAGLWFSMEVTIAVFSLFTVLGLIEFYKLFNQHESVAINWKRASFIGLLTFGLLCFTYMNWIPKSFLYLLIPLHFTHMLLELWRKQDQPIYNIAIQLLGIVYIVFPFYCMIELNQQSTHDLPKAIGMFLLIWTNDTFAFLTGKFLGKTKLFERISPKKTWEGTIGGGLLTIVVATLLAFFYNDKQDLYFWIVAAIIVVPCSVLGDLLESLFKRNLNLKDTGKILPGHGGILDRFDAAIFTAPFFLVWALIYSYLSGETFLF